MSKKQKLRVKARPPLARELRDHDFSIRELERLYIEGYRRKPEGIGWGNAGAKLAAEVWPRDNWGGKSRDRKRREGRRTAQRPPARSRGPGRKGSG